MMTNMVDITDKTSSVSANQFTYLKVDKQNTTKSQ